MFIQVIAKETSDGLWIDRLWTIDFDGNTVVAIHLEGVGYLADNVRPWDWRFSVDSTGWLEFGSPHYVVKGLVQHEYTELTGAPTDGT